jgi:hypothetical protein
MRNKPMKTTLMISLLSLCLCPALFAAATVSGQIPTDGYPKLAEKIDMIWQYEKQKYLGAKEVVDPEIYFSPFRREVESADWITWQNNWIRNNPYIWLDWTEVTGENAPKVITTDWVDAHLADLFPFPKTFRAFHYDNTNRIQIDANTTFLPFYVNDPYGQKADNVGFGFYTTAHELLHYTLEQKGIPGKIHHCLFVTQRVGKLTLIQDLAQFLVDKKISSSYVRIMGADREIDFDPCGQLSAEEQALAKKYAGELP